MLIELNTIVNPATQINIKEHEYLATILKNGTYMPFEVVQLNSGYYALLCGFEIHAVAHSLRLKYVEANIHLIDYKASKFNYRRP